MTQPISGFLVTHADLEVTSGQQADDNESEE